MKLWFIEIMLFLLSILLLFINFNLIDQTTIAEIKLCKENPTLIIKRAGFSTCNCKEIIEKYNIEVDGE